MNLEEEGEEFVSDHTEPISVKVVASETESVAPEFASCMTYPIPYGLTNQGQNNMSYVQIVPRNYHRSRSKMTLQQNSAVNYSVLVINTNADALTGPNPQGWTLVMSAFMTFSLPDYDGQQPLYATVAPYSNAGAIVTVSVIDQLYGKVQ